MDVLLNLYANLDINQALIYCNTKKRVEELEKSMTENDFNYAKAELAKKVQTMLAQGEKLVEEKKRLAERTRSMWMYSRWRAKSSLKSQ